ncbi:hypothetical protein J3R74_002624 [Puniceicoccus vermicola]
MAEKTIILTEKALTGLRISIRAACLSGSLSSLQAAPLYDFRQPRALLDETRPPPPGGDRRALKEPSPPIIQQKRTCEALSNRPAADRNFRQTTKQSPPHPFVSFVPSVVNPSQPRSTLPKSPPPHY